MPITPLGSAFDSTAKTPGKQRSSGAPPVYRPWHVMAQLKPWSASSSIAHSALSSAAAGKRDVTKSIDSRSRASASAAALLHNSSFPIGPNPLPLQPRVEVGGNGVINRKNWGGESDPCTLGTRGTADDATAGNVEFTPRCNAGGVNSIFSSRASFWLEPKNKQRPGAIPTNSPALQNKAAIQRMQSLIEWGKSAVIDAVPPEEKVLEILGNGYGVGRCMNNPNHNGPLLHLYRNQASQGYVSFQIEGATQTVILHTGGGVGADATGILMKHALRILKKEYAGYSLEMAPAPGAATKKTVALLANILKRIAAREGATGAKVGNGERTS